MKRDNKVLNRNLYFGFILSLITFCGCAGMFMAGVPINADEYYPEYIGIKLAPLIFPAAIIKNGKIEEPYIHMPYNQPYGKKIADVSPGTVIIIDHIVRRYNVENEVYDYVMGRVEVPGYSGLVVVGICDGKVHAAVEGCIDLKEYEILSR